MFEKVVTEMKAKPFTMILILSLWAVVWILWSARANYAMAGDVQELKQQYQSLSNSVERNGMETQLRSINSELFQLQQQVQDKQARRMQVERIYWDRIVTLQNDRDYLQRKLQALK